MNTIKQHEPVVNIQLTDSLLALFADDLKDHVNQLQALMPNDWLNHHRLLHRLLGSASYFSAATLRSLLLAADLCTQNQDELALTLALKSIYGEIDSILQSDPMQSQSVRV